MYQPVNRRLFLSRVSGALGGFAIANTFSTPADAQIIFAMRTAAIWLAEHVIAPGAIAVFSNWLQNAKLFRTGEDGSFHDHFNPGVVFDRTFEAERTRWTGYLGVDRIPTMSTSRSMSQKGQLNLAEIGELKNNRNPNLWSDGSLRLAPIPVTLRNQPSQQDLEMMGQDLTRFGQDPSNYTVEYSRGFCDCSGVHLKGFGWSSSSGDVGFRILRA